MQSLVREGQISAEEAAAHPQRQLLLLALDGATDPLPDLSLHAVQPGDRFLLCTDGLHTVVAADDIRSALSSAADPEQAAGDLTGLANSAGGPDNIGCAVADIMDLQRCSPRPCPLAARPDLTMATG